MVEDTLSRSEAGTAGRSWRRLKIGGLVAARAAGGLLSRRMIWLHEIDDDPDFALASTAPEGGSATVAVAADLIDREINTHRWVANDPFFMPGSLLDNMPNFQQGIIAALSRFAVELGDQIARTRGSSQIDRDLDTASGLLKYPGTVWIFDLAVSFAPTASSESQYRRAMRGAARLQPTAQPRARRPSRPGPTICRRPSSGSPPTSARPPRRSTGSSASASRLRPRLRRRRPVLPEQGPPLRLLSAAARDAIDFDKVIGERDLSGAWTQMLDSFRAAATLQPWVVVNGDPASQLLPSHLAAQGFFLLRARTQLKEITNILLK